MYDFQYFIVFNNQNGKNTEGVFFQNIFWLNVQKREKL